MKNNFFLLIIGALLFFGFISFILQLPENISSPVLLYGDPISYWDAAKGIYTEGGQPHPLRPYFYPFLIGLPVFFFGERGYNLEWALGLNIFFWLTTVGFIFKFLIENTNRKIAFIGAFIYVINLSLLIICWTVLAESLFNFLIVGCVYFLSKYLKNKSESGYFIAFFAFLCLSFITRPIFSPLLFFIFPLIIWAIFKRYLSLFIASISLFILLFTVGLNSYKMHQKYGNWTLSYISDCALYVYFGAYAKRATLDKSWAQINADWAVEKASRLPRMARNNDTLAWSTLPPLVKEDLSTQIAENKMGLIIAFIRNLVSNSVSGNTDLYYLTNFKKNTYFTTLLPYLYALRALQNAINSGMALLFFPILLWRFRAFIWSTNHPILWILVVNSLLSVVAILFASVSFSQGDRFHLVVAPLTILSFGIYFFHRNNCKLLIIK